MVNFSKKSKVCAITLLCIISSLSKGFRFSNMDQIKLRQDMIHIIETKIRKKGMERRLVDQRVKLIKEIRELGGEPQYTSLMKLRPVRSVPRKVKKSVLPKVWYAGRPFVGAKDVQQQSIVKKGPGILERLELRQKAQSKLEDRKRKAAQWAIERENRINQLSEEGTIVLFSKKRRPASEKSQSDQEICLFEEPSLHESCEKGLLGAVKFLLKKNTNRLTEKDQLGRIPLHYACRSSNLDLVIWLLKKAEKVQKLQNVVFDKDNDGKTVLQHACCSENKEIFNHLVNTLDFADLIEKKYEERYIDQYEADSSDEYDFSEVEKMLNTKENEKERIAFNDISSDTEECELDFDEIIHEFENSDSEDNFNDTLVKRVVLFKRGPQKQPIVFFKRGSRKVQKPEEDIDNLSISGLVERMFGKSVDEEKDADRADIIQELEDLWSDEISDDEGDSDLF